MDAEERKINYFHRDFLDESWWSTGYLFLTIDTVYGFMRKEVDRSNKLPHIEDVIILVILRMFEIL